MPQHPTLLTTQPLSALTRCIRLALGLAVSGAILTAPVFAEGTKQWAPSSSHFAALGAMETGSANANTYPFAGYNQPAERRLHIHIADPDNEIVYIGLGNMTGNVGDTKSANYYWRIKAPDGTVVHGAHMAGGASSNLDTHAKAVAGPSVLNPAGYATAGNWTFDPAAAGKGAGDYYIEFDINNNADTVGTFPDSYNGLNYGDVSSLNINWFDITVATKGASPQAIDGRLWSQSWGVRTNDPAVFPSAPFGTPFNGNMFTYDTNNFVTKVDFLNSGLRPLQGQFSFNETGTGNTGNKVQDRKSVTNANRGNPQHKIFLNPPDPNVFPLGQEGQLQGLPLAIDNINNTNIQIEVTQPGRVEIMLDINKDGSFTQGVDRRLFADVAAGVNQVPWDGNNGAGVKVPKSAFPIDVMIAYTQGETHFTAYDVEGLDNGFQVFTQTAAGTIGPNLLFWDDSNISVSSGVSPEVKVNTDASNTIRQRWTNIAYGDLHTINTWWFAYRDYRSTVLVVNNVPPVANNDSATTAEDTVLNGTTVLSNDTDADGDTLTVNTTPITAPTHGTLVLRADGTYTYTPHLNYHGTDSFVYEISDGHGGTATATVTITITPVNDPPVAVPDTASTDEDTPLHGASVLGNDVDVDGDTLTVDTTPATPPAHGTLVLNSDGTYLYTPNADFHGTDSFAYTVLDGQGGSSSTTVTITVNPVNDSPVAVNDSATTLEDTALNGTTVLANDSDVDGDTLAVNTTPVTSPNHGSLTLNSNGTYTYTPNRDYHGTDSFVYEVLDGNGGTATATVTITIIPVNDPPVAVDDSATLDEDTVLHAPSVLVNDYDVDGGDKLTVNTTPVTPPVHGTLVLRADGTFTYTPNKDYFGTDSFVYEVLDDHGGKDTATVTLTILPVNDPPVITSTNNVTFAENGTGTVLNVQSTDDHDAESNGLTYALQPMFDGHLFELDPVTGELTFKSPPDYEAPQDANRDNAYILMAKVCDQEGLCTEQVIVVVVTNVLESSPPKIISMVVTVPENQTLVTTVGATDPDPDDVLTFSIVGDADEHLFTIDPATGELRFKSAPNFENPLDTDRNNEYEIIVQVHDNTEPDHVDTQAIRIRVTNVNEAPLMTLGGGTPQTLELPENTQPVTTVTASDVDVGDVLTYRITGGADADLFRIDSATGQLTFLTAPDFENPSDSDQNNTYAVEVTVNDLGNLTATQRFTIVITDANDAPLITSDDGGDHASLSIAENTKTVTTVTSIDQDGDTPTYTITGGADAGLFTINPQSGELSFTVAPDFENPLDADGNNIYNVIITVSDGRGGIDTQQLAISVTDVNETPVITSNGGSPAGSLIMAENNTAVTTVVANDPDAGDTLTYSISGGADASLFEIDPVTGALVFKVAPDFENPQDTDADNRYQIEVTATDSKGAVDPQTLTIQITDTNDAPVITSDGGGALAELTIEENTTAVTTVTSTDQDDDAPTYTLSGGADAALFEIDPTTGLLVFKTAPDFETPTDADQNNIYEVMVTVSDDQGGSTVQTLLITVADANDDPVITSNGGGETAALDVDENTTVVTTVTSTDQDGDTPTYLIGGGDDAGLFQIDPVTGVLSFKIPPDFERPQDSNNDNRYEVIVVVDDGKGGKDTQALLITVRNVNDPPIIISNRGDDTAEVTVDENQVGVTLVQALDDDGDKRTYSISGGADADLFAINNATGALVFVSPPDFENPTDSDGNGVYQVEITVVDGKGGQDTQRLNVTVANANEPPVFTSHDGKTTASLRQPEGQTSVTTMIATDPDKGDTLRYSITGGADFAQFVIDPATGVLAFKAVPDYEKPTDADKNNQYQVEITVNDREGRFDVQTLTITIENVNDAPQFTSHGGEKTVNLSVVENTTAITTVTATDPDGDNLTYSISGGVDASLFTLDPQTGELTFTSSPDFENPTDHNQDNRYEVIVSATDPSGEQTSQTFIITVTDDRQVALQVRAFLQGAYVSGTGMMTDNLRKLGILPAVQPYQPEPLRHNGNETLHPAVAAIEGKDAVVDWMLIDLRSAANPQTILKTQAVMVQRDGDLVDPQTGNDTLVFRDVLAGDYYVSVRHRNHLGVMSAAAIRLSDAATLVNFTRSTTATYGNHTRLETSQAALLWAGDANQSQQLIANGPFNDTNLVLGTVLSNINNDQANSNYRLHGYLSTDLNMDGISLFAGPGNDINILLGNVLLHPGNGVFAANYIVNGTLPK